MSNVKLDELITTPRHQPHTVCWICSSASSGTMSALNETSANAAVCIIEANPDVTGLGVRRASELYHSSESQLTAT